MALRVGRPPAEREHRRRCHAGGTADVAAGTQQPARSGSQAWHP